jgi:hypothetical protein
MFSKITSFAATAALTASLAGSVSGHLILQNPVPFGVDTLDNSPLLDVAIGSATSNFPCKQRQGVYDISTMNNMKVGDPQLLDFKGSASHGGGTCQLAISTDKQPTANSTWKLIQVYQGDCPTSASGNGETDKFTWSLPKETPNGQITFTWIWYNYEGNREIYMNCAPIMVTGGSDSLDGYNSLPNAFIINLTDQECGSPENVAVIIPTPGQYFLKGKQTQASATGPSCSASIAAQTSGVTGLKTAVITSGASYGAPATNGDSTAAASGGSAGATSAASSANNGQYSGNNGQYTQASTSAAATSVAATSAAASAPASTAQSVAASSAPATTASTASSGFLTISTAAGGSSPAASASSSSDSSDASSAHPYPSSSAAASSAAASSASSAAAPAATGGSSSSTGNSTASSTGSCNGASDGAVVCNGPNQFGLCNQGSVVWQAVAAGTTCSNGTIAKRGAAIVGHPHARRHVRLY